jgi:hypothetical protein
MNIFEPIFLIFAHHIGDVACQPSWLIKNKHEHTFAIYEHSVVWTAVVSFMLLALGILELWKILFLLIGHFVIDWFKYKRLPDNYNYIYIDQLLHYAQIMICLI